MNELLSQARELAWPLALLLAWLAGELVYRRLRLPRISVYALVGFVLAPAQMGLLPATPAPAVLLLINIAFGLILFEAGHRINLHWLRRNPWLIVTSLSESLLTFAAVLVLARGFSLPANASYLLAVLSIATSPATVVRVINEQRSSGQVTERVMHLAVLNCVVAVLGFKIVVGLMVFDTSGNLLEAMYSSLVVLLISVFLGALFGQLMPLVLRGIQRTREDSTLAFAIALVLLVALTHALHQSPVLAALTFGLVARHQRTSLSPAQRGFGSLGDLLSLLLFVFVATTLDWRHVMAGMGMGLSLIVVRALAKVAGIALFAHFSGTSWRKGLLTSIAMTPLSVVVILLLEQTRHLGLELLAQLSPLAAMVLVLEIFGPLLTLLALRLAREVPDSKET